MSTGEHHERPLAGALSRVRNLTLVDHLTGRKPVFPDRIPVAAYEEPVLKLREITGDFILLSDPAGVRQVLVDKAANYPKSQLEQRFFSAMFGSGLLGSDGEVWRTHRRIMAPAFDLRSVAAYAPAMGGSAEALLARWDGQPEGAVAEISGEMSTLALQIITRTMFSVDSDDIVELIADILHRAPAAARLKPLDLAPIVGPIRFEKRKALFAEIFAPLDREIARLIAAREADPAGGPQDLLARLIAARDAETGLSMTAQEVRDEVVTIFIAGHETAASAMTFLWYVLARHPEETARLHEELDRVLGGRTPGQQDIGALPYTRRVVEEAMRLYPPAPGLSNRIAQAEDEVCGVRVKKGASIGIAPWLLHRHRRLWDDPERFDPDRFLPERSEGRPRLAYMPFGSGPRVCVGQLMAINEVVLVAATIAQRYRLEMAQDDVRLGLMSTLRASGGLKMSLHRR